MKIILLAIGKLKNKSCESLVADYSERLSHYCDFEMKDVSDEQKIFKEIKQGDYLMVLDDKGLSMTSKKLSETMQNLQNRSIKRLLLVIGDSYGHSEELKKKADSLLSLSVLTLPHELARVVLVEQLYRAYTILRGEKYHH